MQASHGEGKNGPVTVANFLDAPHCNVGLAQYVFFFNLLSQIKSRFNVPFFDSDYRAMVNLHFDTAKSSPLGI